MYGKTLFRTVMLCLCAVSASGTAQAAKTDVVQLANGDAVTGEVKSLDFGSLRYGTDSMGTVTIDWEDVTGLTSDQNLQVELLDGTRYFGQLVVTEGGERQISVKTRSGVVTFGTNEIIRMTPIESADNFFEKLDGSFSLGIQAQSSDASNSSALNADISYRTRTYLAGLRLSSTVTDQPLQETKRRHNIGINYQRFRPNRWFADWFSGWERNDQLGLLSRTSAGAAWGRYLVQSNRHLFSLTGGAQAARETYIGSEPSDVVYEGRVEVRYLYRNLTPESNISFTTQYFPLLGNLSEYRAESDLTLRWEMVKDVFWDLSVGYSYVSDPPEGGEKSDHAVTTSIGYSF